MWSLPENRCVVCPTHWPCRIRFHEPPPSPGSLICFIPFCNLVFIQARFPIFFESDSVGMNSSSLLCFGTLTLAHRHNRGLLPLSFHWNNRPGIGLWYTLKMTTTSSPPLETWRRLWEAADMTDLIVGRSAGGGKGTTAALSSHCAFVNGGCYTLREVG